MAAQELANIAIKLSANMVDFENDIGRAARLAQKRSGQMRKSFNQAFKAISVAAIAAGGALATLVKASANTADGIQKMSTRLGVSTEFLSQYRHVAKLSGTSLEKVGAGVLKMTKTINDSNNGLTTATAAFNAIGVSLEDLNALSPEDQFELIADKISKLENHTIKAGSAMDIFGKSGAELLTVMEGGAEGIKAMREEADRFGFTISQSAADGAANFNDELTRLEARAQGFAESLGLSLLPALTEVINQLNSDGVSNADQDFQALQNTIGNVFGSILFLKGGYEVIGEAVAVMVTKSLAAFDIIKNSLESFVLRFKRGALIIKSVWDETADDAQRTMSNNIDKLSQQTDALLKQFQDGTADEEFFKKANKIWGEATDKMNAVKNATAKTSKVLKKDLEPTIKKLGLTTAKTSKELEKLANEALKEIIKKTEAFAGVAESLETPLESLDRLFLENTTKIGEFVQATVGLSDKQEEAAKVMERLNAEYLKNKKALKEVLDPYQDLLDSLDEELFLLGANSQELIENNAKRLLVQAGVIKAGESFENYGDEIEEVTEKLQKLNAEQGIFGNGIDSFSDLLRDASKDFSTFFDTIFKGFENMGSSAEGFAEGISSIADFASGAIGIFESTSGQDDAGRILDTVSQIASTGVLGPIAQAIAAVASLINDITGGGLFGTKFEVTGSTRNLNIGADGAGGGIETRESRRRSLFRGTQRRTTSTDLDDSTLNALNLLFDNLQIAIQNSAAAVGGVAGDLISGSFAQEFDKDGNLVSEISTVLGRVFDESFEDFGQRLTAENILAGVSSVFSDVRSIAGRWIEDAGDYLEGAQLLLVAGSAISSGGGLFDTLQQIADIIPTMSKFGETLTETYIRVSGAVSLLDDALEVVGVSFRLGREAYVNLAADIVEAAGGLPEAASLWSSYFDTFFSEQELFQQNLSSARALRDTSLGDLGIDTGISAEAFREMFEAILPTLSAEGIVEWLRAADALGVVIDLERELTEQRVEERSALTEILNDIIEANATEGMSDFALALRDIKNRLAEQIKTAKKLGATEKELAMIQAFAARQIQNIIISLEETIGSALNDLFGTELDQINDQISLLESQESQIQNVQQASNDLYDSQLRAIKNIGDFVDSLFLSAELSPLNAGERLDEALSQFNELLNAAQSGDVDALNQLPNAAQILLSLGRDVFASSQGFTDLFDFVTGSLSGLGVTATQETPQQTIIGQNQEMIDLLARRNELEEQFDSDARLNAALAIAAQIAELVSVTRESFVSLAERLGIPVEQFLSDLGISLEDLTSETALALAETAALLGIELADLAESVGISLGDLADSESLLNDALEGTISNLPKGIQDLLGPLLEGIENATNARERERLLAEFIEIADNLPAAQRDLLAPFFEQIDPITEAQEQINQMNNLNNSNDIIAREVETLRIQSLTNDETTGVILTDLLDETRTQNEEILNLIAQIAS